MTRVEIVSMAQAHLDAIASLEARCFSQPWSRAGFAEELQNSNALFLAAQEDGALLGYAGMQFAAGEFYVCNIAVDPACRRRGIGEALLSALVQAAVQRGGRFISLEVRPSNQAALGLYRKLGFSLAGRRKDFYARPREDALILTLYLKGGDSFADSRH